MQPLCLRRFLQAAGLFSGLLCGSLFAATETLPLTITPDLTDLAWVVSNTGGTTGATAYTGNCDGTSPGFSLSEATSASGASDAYDNAFMLFVDDVVFATATVDLSGDLLTAGPVSLSGLDTSIEILFPGALQAARIRMIFDNPTAAAISATVDVPVNLGSDAFTLIEQTASGDTVFSSADRWIITSDSSLTTEPVVTSVLYGPGTPAAFPANVTRTVCSDGADTDGVGFSFNLTVPANSTRSLLFFAALGDIQGTGNTAAGAITFVTMFNSNTGIDTRLMTGLSDSELQKILNWNFPATLATSSEDEDKTFIDDFIGCSLGRRSAGDPLLPLLVVLAIGGLLCKRLPRARTPH